MKLSGREAARYLAAPDPAGTGALLFGADATRTFEADHPGLRGWRFWVLIAASEGVVGALLLTQWAQGKALYGALATYHVYLEFPLLVGLWLGASRGAFARRG